MPIKLQAKKELRLVPVRFVRAVTGAPDADFPDIDDRGNKHKIPKVNGLAESKEIRGGVIGVKVGQQVTVHMLREDIETDADLFLCSSDTGVIAVVKPGADGKCDSKKTVTLTLKGASFSGSTPKSAQIEVRFGAKDGPIIAALNVYVFPKLLVTLQPITVTINDSSGSGGIAPTLDTNTLMQQVSALWAPCGVEIDTQASKSISVKLAQPNKMKFSELNTIFAKKWVSSAINVYVVQEIDDALGLGISRAVHASYGLTHPGVFLGMISGTTNRTTDTYWCANDLAHELGHFFKLYHPSDEPSSGAAGWERFDTWSMRHLMHNYNTTWRPNVPQGGKHWKDFNDFGYGTTGGSPYRAGLINLKSVRASAGAGIEGQCSIARNHIAKGSGTLY